MWSFHMICLTSLTVTADGLVTAIIYISYSYTNISYNTNPNPIPNLYYM